MYQSTLAHKLFCLYSVKSKPALEILISKLMFKMDFSVSVYAVNSRKSDAVKGVVFAHGVYCHVAENKPVAYGKGLVKGIVADDISGQTGSGSETIGVRLFACLSAAYDVGAIWHFQHIGHMAGSRCVDYGMAHSAAFKHFKHFRYKPACIKSRCLTRFNIYLNIVFILNAADDLAKLVTS